MDIDVINFLLLPKTFGAAFQLKCEPSKTFILGAIAMVLLIFQAAVGAEVAGAHEH